MGVLKDNKESYNLNQRLLESNLVIPTVMDDSDTDMPEATTSPKVRRKKVFKSTRTPCPMTHMKRSGRKAHGSKNSRRYENTCFLLDLVGNEECGEITAQDFLNSNQTAFERLFTEEGSMKIWNNFVNQSEEEQDKYLKNLEEKKAEICTNDNKKEPVADGDDRLIHPEFNAGTCYKRISARFRNTLRRRHPPKGMLEYLEEELVCWFSDDPCAVYISCLPNSFERLLLHALSQYLDLQSKSFTQGNKRRTKVENSRDYFSPPGMLLSQYMQAHC